VCAILDSNSDTSNIDLPIPGNDDAARAIALYCDLVAKAALDGIARQQGGSGVDLGAQVEAPQETVLEDTSVEAAPAEPAPVAAAPAEAAPAETAPAAPLFTAPEGDGDDLTEINGIGPVAKQQLNEQGITTFKQIAELTAEDVQRVDDYMPFSSAQIEDWKAQAAAKG
ncbi:MAG: 30S ribosomal protein S2, partial [Pseudomonadota bacterium]